MRKEILGSHTLYQGDTNEIMEQLVKENVKVDFVLTSPPYNAFRNDYYTGSGDINDSKDNEEYKDWLVSHFILYDKLLEKCGLVIYNLNYLSNKKNTAGNLYRNITAIEDGSPFILIDVICWKKPGAMPIREARLTRVWENVFIFMRKDEWESFHKKYKDVLTGKKNYIEAPNNDKTNDINKACFSSDLVYQLLDIYKTKDNAVILDNFMGTGTTSVGCEKIGYKSIGIELCEDTYNYSLERVKNYIGSFEDLEETNLFNWENKL